MTLIRPKYIVDYLIVKLSKTIINHILLTSGRTEYKKNLSFVIAFIYLFSSDFLNCQQDISK